MVSSFKQFIEHLIIENLHPELQHIVTSKSEDKHSEMANKIKELVDRGEPTGIEGNMPKGSSRAYLPHKDTEKITLDGNPENIRVGTKVAIKARLDKFHDKKSHDDLTLGQMQNKAENSDHYVNSRYRILTKNNDGSFANRLASAAKTKNTTNIDKAIRNTI